MKRLFTIALIAMVTSLTFAQAPLAKKAVSGNKLERIANLEDLKQKAKETKELQAAQAAKAADAAVEVTSTSVLRRSGKKAGMQNSVKGMENGTVTTKAGTLSSVNGVDGKVIKTWMQGGFRSEVANTPYKSTSRKTTTQEGNVTVTTDANGIITDVTGVEPKMYERSATGTTYYPSDQKFYFAAQSGMVTIVEDGDNVYIKDPITRLSTGAWVKGTKSGNVITVATHQPLLYNAGYDATVSLRWGVFSGGFNAADDYAEAFTYTVNGDVLTLEGTAKHDNPDGAYMMSAFWDDDNSPINYADAETVLSYNAGYVPPSTELVTLPAGVEYTGWYMNYTSVTSNDQTLIKNQSVNVAFAGNDVYVQGISTAFPDAWVKGTIDGTTVKFDKFQYVGAYNGAIDCWFIGYDTDESVITDVTATYDATAKTITFVEDALINAATDRVYYLSWFSDVVISEEAEEVPVLVALPDGAEYTGWYMNCVDAGEETLIKNQKVNVAFVGNDIYVQGISTAFPTSWVKGTIDGTTVKFDKFQYVGTYGTYYCWFVGVDPEDEEGTLKDVIATYDAAAKTITFVDHVLTNAAKDKIYYLEWFYDITISAEEVVYEEPVLTDLTATIPYLNTFDTEEEQAQVAIYDANKDNSTFTFEEHGTTNSIVAKYRYNSDNNADDYLVFPGVTLKAGTVYTISIDAAANSTSYEERVEVIAGKEAKASQFTIPVIPATELATKEFTTLSNNEFTVEEDGTYYIAVHVISDKDKFYLFVDNFSITTLDEQAPADINDFTVAPDAQGANKATVTFTVPAKTVGGTDITENVNVVVKRDGEVIYSEAKAAGENVAFDNEVPAPDYYTYSVTASCGEHVGNHIDTKVYIGYDTPDVVNNLTIADKSGAVALAWEAPTGGANGYVVNPADFVYNIYPVEMVEFWGFTFPSTDFANPYATGVTETSATVEYNTNEGEHTFTYFAVTAENTTGESEDVYAAVVTGAPFEMPVFESVANGGLSYWWGTGCDRNNSYLDGGLYLGENASDGDGYCFQMVAETMGWINLQSGKIALAGAANPALTFDYASDNNATLTVYVITPNGEKEVATLTPAADYAPATISLVEFANEDWVRVIITGTFPAAGNAYIDNIRVYNMLDNNLVAKGIKATSSVYPGDDVTVTVTVENQGALTAEAGAYTVDLYCNDAKVQSLQGTALESNAKTEFVFTETTNVMSPRELVWKAIVEYAADNDNSNDTTATAKTVVKTNNYPAVTDLAGEQTDDAVSLTWSEPDMTVAIPKVVTDDFESYEGFTTSAGEWTFVDVDDAEVGGFKDLDFTVNGADILQSKQSFWVHDVTDGETWNETFAANSGTKYLAAMFRYDDGQADDWAISPVLSGNAQTVSFYARSYSGSYPEKVEVLYSTGSTNTEDFIVAKAATVVPAEWTEFTAELPEGAKYFAIRSCAASSFMLMIDDVTYETLGGTDELALVGYNVYRDGVKLNAEPVVENNYTDATATEGEHSYVVTVVYDKGESKISNVVTVSFVDGIASIATKATNVSVNNKTITVANAAGKNVSICTVDGKTVYNAAGSDITRVRVESGVYIVKTGNTVVKTVVK